MEEKEKELKELLRKLEEKLGNPEENKKNIEEGKKEIKEKFINKETRTLIFSNDIRTITIGRKIDIMKTVSTMIDNLKNNLGFEEMVDCIIAGMTLGEDGEIDKEQAKAIINLINRRMEDI